MNSLIQYLKDTRAEFTHVTWPTQRQAIVYTALVVAISVFVSLFLGLFDFLFSKAINLIIG